MTIYTLTSPESDTDSDTPVSASKETEATLDTPKNDTEPSPRPSTARGEDRSTLALLDNQLEASTLAGKTATETVEKDSGTEESFPSFPLSTTNAAGKRKDPPSMATSDNEDESSLDLLFKSPPHKKNKPETEDTAQPPAASVFLPDPDGGKYSHGRRLFSGGSSSPNSTPRSSNKRVSFRLSTKDRKRQPGHISFDEWCAARRRQKTLPRKDQRFIGPSKEWKEARDFAGASLRQNVATLKTAPTKTGGSSEPSAQTTKTSTTAAAAAPTVGYNNGKSPSNELVPRRKEGDKTSRVMVTDHRDYASRPEGQSRPIANMSNEECILCLTSSDDEVTIGEALEILCYRTDNMVAEVDYVTGVVQVLNAGGCLAILATMRKFPNSELIQNSALALFYNLVSKKKDYQFVHSHLMKFNALQVVFQAMKHFPIGPVQRNAVKAVYSMVQHPQVVQQLPADLTCDLVGALIKVIELDPENRATTLQVNACMTLECFAAYGSWSTKFIMNSAQVRSTVVNLMDTFLENTDLQRSGLGLIQDLTQV